MSRLTSFGSNVRPSGRLILESSVGVGIAGVAVICRLTGRCGGGYTCGGLWGGMKHGVDET